MIYIFLRDIASYNTNFSLYYWFKICRLAHLVLVA
jgi:hypothetical protein